MFPVCKRSLLPLAAAVLLLALPARAGEFESGLGRLGSPDRDAVAQGIQQLGNLGDPRALPVLQALEDGKLVVDEKGRVFYEQEAALLDAATGNEGQPTGSLKQPLVDNRLRRLLSPALAQLRMDAPDPSVRLGAAEELAKRASPEDLPLLERALKNERDGDILDVLALAQARIQLGSDDVASRLAALKVIDDLGDVTFEAALERMVEQKPDGGFVEENAEVRAAAQSALVSVRGRIFFVNVVANLFYGVSLGSVLLLAALGLAITFGLMGVINMAHGEMLMLGAYTTYVVQNLFGEYLPGHTDYYIVVAIPAAFTVAALVGVLLERTVIRYLYGRPLETLLATWGLSLLLIQTVRLMFGAQNVTVANPSWLSGGWELMPTVVLPYSRIGVILFVLVVVSFVWWLLQKTPLGLHVRAVTQNRQMAAGIGIPTRRGDMWTFGLGSGVAGLGGVALSQLGNVGPELGQGYIVDSFMVVVVGGVGNIIGTVVGALGLGILNKFIEPVSGAVLGKILILALLILFIQKRPQGIFALKGRAAEA